MTTNTSWSLANSSGLAANMASMSTLRKTCWSESNARPASSDLMRSGRSCIITLSLRWRSALCHCGTRCSMCTCKKNAQSAVVQRRNAGHAHGWLGQEGAARAAQAREERAAEGAGAQTRREVRGARRAARRASAGGGGARAGARREPGAGRAWRCGAQQRRHRRLADGRAGRALTQSWLLPSSLHFSHTSSMHRVVKSGRPVDGSRILMRRV
jgi:hypothetical protein